MTYARSRRVAQYGLHWIARYGEMLRLFRYGNSGPKTF